MMNIINALSAEKHSQEKRIKTLIKNCFIHHQSLCFLLLIIHISVLQKGSLGNAPVTVFYGLNESHSNNWARMTEDGTIGISIFWHSDSNHDTGSLIYKTISPNGEENSEEIISGIHMENSILLYDFQYKPHVFLATSNDSCQTIQRFAKDDEGNWRDEIVIQFNNEGGKYIYELSADTGPDYSFHLLLLKIRSNPDSDDYWYAYLNSSLYYISNSTGTWEKELIDRYHTLYTMDEYSKTLNRQDMKIDKNGNAHVIYNEQANGEDWGRSHEILHYGTNKSGEWSFEKVIDRGEDTRYSAGWYSSLALDKDDVPGISCCNIGRVPTGSASNAKLIYISKKENNWIQDTVCETDDGYYGRDGRRYTGGVTHLVFDQENKPHIVFSDIASSHSGSNYFNLGNIRHTYKEGEEWKTSKIHEHPLPSGRYNATETYDLCMMINQRNGDVHIIGQELRVFDSETYTFSLTGYHIPNETNIYHYRKHEKSVKMVRNFPNPFNQETTIGVSVERRSRICLTIYNIEGKRVKTILDEIKSPGIYYETWDGRDEKGMKVSSGVYFCHLTAEGNMLAARMLLLK